MKKIGLVTWYDRGPNYGTTLQAFALVEYIKKLGYDCEIINYKSKTVKQKFKRFLLDGYLYFNKNVTYKKHKCMYRWIKNNLSISTKIYNKKNLILLNNEYDAFICGSDQIWSTAENEIDPFYYLSFTSDNKKISYAPSIGKNIVGEKVKEDFISLVSRFNHLSVREKKGADIIYNLTGKKPKIMIDPTLLLRSEEWKDKLELREHEYPKKYIFCYFLRENSEYYEAVKVFAKTHNFEILNPAEIYNTCGKNVIMDSKLFLEYLLNSSFVVTDSFHGMVFSIIFHKKFCVFRRYKDNEIMSQNSRIYGLLEQLDLMGNIYNNNIEKIFNLENNYEKVDEIINKLRDNSNHFLSSSITEATK